MRRKEQPTTPRAQRATAWTAGTQLEFLDIHRGQRRPAGGGEVIGGFFVYLANAQRVDQVAYTLCCTTEHIYHHIQQGEFPDAIDIGSTSARTATYRIPRCDVLDYLNLRKEGGEG